MCRDWKVAQVEQEVVQDVSWSTIRGWAKAREVMEAQIAAALREKHQRLGPQAFLEECTREMGWAKTTVYRHLNPALAEAARQDTAKRASSKLGTDPLPHNPDLDTDDPVEDSDGFKDLALELVTAGFKNLATLYHPDKASGNLEKMKSLNTIRKKLISIVEREWK